MRVAVVCPYDLGLPGGVQQVTLELVDRLRDRGTEAWLVGPGRHPDATSVGGTTRLRGNHSVVPLALGWGVARAVGEAVEGADVVHVHEPLMPRVSTSAMTVRQPRVATFHADAPNWVRRGYRVLPRRWRRRLRDSVVTAVSPVAAGALPESFGPIEIVPNGIHVSAFTPGDKIAHRVTFLGRDEPRKGLGTLLEAWPAVRSRVPDAELIVMGARRSVAPEGVRFLGRVDEETKRTMLGTASVHVAPNTGGESFGIVLVEAMAAGAALVTSDIPAFTAVLAEAGVQVPVGEPTALAEAVGRLLERQDEVAALSRAGRARAAEFDWSVVVDRYLEAYRRAAD